MYTPLFTNPATINETLTLVLQMAVVSWWLENTQI